MISPTESVLAESSLQAGPGVGVSLRPVEVPISLLMPADSPRLAGVCIDHARTLAESEEQLPPIVVHRATMRVIDGVHRLRAAVLRGKEVILVQFFEGDEAAAFVLAVQANVAHGLPLTLAERAAAAARIIASHPLWSDRMIAANTGLSPKTVGAVRSRSSEEIPQSSVRVGRDGRVRRVNRRLGGRTADDVRADYSQAKLRQVGAVGGSVSNPARDPRDRCYPTQDDDGPDLQERRGPEQRPAQLVAPVAGKRTSATDRTAVVEALRRDPSLRFTESGKLLLRMLDLHSLAAREWDRIITNVPPHCATRIADLAREYASAWQALADRLSQIQCK